MVAGAKAAAEATKRAETTAVNFMVSFSVVARGTIKCLVNRVGSDRHPTALVLMPADNNIEKSNDDDDQTSC